MGCKVSDLTGTEVHRRLRSFERVPFHESGCTLAMLGWAVWEARPV